MSASSRNPDDGQLVPAGNLVRPKKASPALPDGVDRRRFLSMGVGSALSSLALTGCIRKPKEKIVPFARRPEDLIPGKPRYYATSAFVAGSAVGLMVESQDGRPTKIEGNPNHPANRGASSSWIQAEVLNLYDVDRAKNPTRDGKDLTWEQAWTQVDALMSKGGPTGSRLAVVSETLPSPTFERLLGELRQKRPELMLVEHDLAASEESRAANELLGMENAVFLPHYDRADVIVALDADILGLEPDSVRASRLWADRRRIETEKEDIGRLYAVEPCFTVTGASADNRLRLPASRVAAFVGALAAELVHSGLALPNGTAALNGELAKAERGGFGAWIPALAKDLLAHRGKVIVVAGRRQPARVHAMAALLNHALGSIGTTITVVGSPVSTPRSTLEQLAKRIEGGTVDALVVLGGNPCYDAPRDLRLKELFGKISDSVHLSSHRNETSEACKVHVPRSHFLESWGDLRAIDGTVAMQQPLIAPLYDTVSELEFLARMVGASTTRGYELVRSTWQGRNAQAPAAFERNWRRWLHDGVASLPAEVSAPEPRWDRLQEAWSAATPPPTEPGALEVDFALDASTFDGRYANNGWMQEAPDPTTKLTWDNAACLGKTTAAALGVSTGDVVRLKVAGAELEIPVLVLSGTADNTVVLALGYGRRSGGKVAKDVGADTFALRTQSGRWIAFGASIEPMGRKHELATTQEHDSQEGRAILRETTLAKHRADPKAIGHVEGPPLKSLWEEPNVRTGQQWGMSIDLSSCTGCNACVLACQAENNIPVVGKERVLDGREMHWIRIDRYFAGDGDEEVMSSQPMACTHCENAPCESVCPVAATVHSPEGLNDMAYNRCIGTRYCSNNCPLKVRRFNFFNYNNDIEPAESLQKNPDVTIRFRGVMEKCTYCVQRINEQKIIAKRDGDGVVPDGAIVTACEQACPTRAIVFGDVNSSTSAVSKAKRQDRDYSVLAELNIKPRTTYLARVRNPNPELV